MSKTISKEWRYVGSHMSQPRFSLYYHEGKCLARFPDGLEIIVEVVIRPAAGGFTEFDPRDCEKAAERVIEELERKAPFLCSTP